jgi:hypothetical protein
MLLQELRVRPTPSGEGEPTVRDAKEVLPLFVDKVRGTLLTQHHLELVEGTGQQAAPLPVHSLILRITPEQTLL